MKITVSQLVKLIREATSVDRDKIAAASQANRVSKLAIDATDKSTPEEKKEIETALKPLVDDGIEALKGSKDPEEFRAVLGALKGEKTEARLRRLVGMLVSETLGQLRDAQETLSSHFDDQR